MDAIKIKLESKTVVSQQFEGASNVRENILDEPEVYENLDSELDLSKILSDVLSQMTNEEFDEAWAKVKERVNGNGTDNQIL